MSRDATRSNYSLRVNDGLIMLPDWHRSGIANLKVPTEAALVTQAAAQAYPIGTQLRKFGKIYRYCKAGAAMTDRGFLKGNYFQVPGKAGNSVNSGYEAALYAAVVAGQTYFDITDTAAAVNEYEGAYAAFYDDTNSLYDDYMVIGNDVSTGVYTRLYIADPGFKGAHAAAVQATVYRNPYMGIRSYATVGSYGTALGYAKFSITSAYYFWLQTAGIISGITGASTWPGQTAYQRDVYCNTDGSLIGITSTTYLYQRIGFLLGRTASDYGDNCIMLQLDQ